MSEIGTVTAELRSRVINELMRYCLNLVYSGSIENIVSNLLSGSTTGGWVHVTEDYILESISPLVTRCVEDPFNMLPGSMIDKKIYLALLINKLDMALDASAVTISDVVREKILSCISQYTIKRDAATDSGQGEGGSVREVAVEAVTALSSCLKQIILASVTLLEDIHITSLLRASRRTTAI